VVAEWVGLVGAGHYMVRRWREWHRHAAEFVAEQFDVAKSDKR
jgi:SRSO17 transposase